MKKEYTEEGEEGQWNDDDELGLQIFAFKMKNCLIKWKNERGTS